MRLPGSHIRHRAGVLTAVAIRLFVLALTTQIAASAAGSPHSPQRDSLHGAAPAHGRKDADTARIAVASETLLHGEDREEFRREREALRRSAVTLRISGEILQRDSRLPAEPFRIPIADHPDWIARGGGWLNVRPTLDEEKVRAFIEEKVIPQIPEAGNLRVLALPADGIPRATVEGEIFSGWRLRSDETAALISRSVEAGLLTVTIPLEEVQGTIVNETGVELGELTLLSTGRSNFSGSVPNRIHNIKKALNEHLNGVLIAPGGTFSFNDTLGGIVEERTGWKTALGIFNEDELQPTAGGGICQVSTTAYRALVQLGLPILERRNHSMYIRYYRQYGEGLDATIFVGSQNLVARNDTPGYLFVRAYDEGDEAVVEIYGTPDGRSVALEGPYRRSDAPPEVRSPDGKRGLGRNDIAWKQTIMRSDGTVEKNILISRYQTDIPKEPEGAWTVVNGEWRERTASTGSGEEDDITI